MCCSRVQFRLFQFQFALLGFSVSFYYILVYHSDKIKMKTFLMPLLGIINILINVAGICCIFLYPPQPYAILVISIFPLALIAYTQTCKRRLLLQKQQILSMVLFGFLIVLSVFFLTMGLTVLIYIEQVHNKVLQQNKSFDQIMWQESKLSMSNIQFISIGFYTGNFLTISLYTREYYLMFWVNHVVHIFRYLRSKVHHFNETLLSHLPKIKITKQIKKQKCCLCIEYYQEFQEVTKLNCAHIFHRDCIRLWVLRSNACPLCRKRAVYY